MSRLAAPNFDEIETLGGALRCSRCRREEPVGDPVQRDRYGWPVCCGETMLMALPRPARASFDPRSA